MATKTQPRDQTRSQTATFAGLFALLLYWSTFAFTVRAAAQVVLPASGLISTVAGTGVAGYNGDSIAATTAQLNLPRGVAVDTSGNIYIADSMNSRVREITASMGDISTVAGTATGGYNGDNIPATSAELSDPMGVALDAAGNMYIADTGNERIRKVTLSTGKISTLAGDGVVGSYGEYILATHAQLSFPTGVALDAAGNVYIADSGNNLIRAVNTGKSTITIAGITILPGDIATVAGTGNTPCSGSGVAATSIDLSEPYGVAVDSAGNIYIADTMNNCIREVAASTGIISTVAGTGAGGFKDGVATQAWLDEPYGVAIDIHGNIYIADLNNARLREVTVANGIISTLAGTGVNGFYGDGGAAVAAKLNAPAGVTIDSHGNYFIADEENQSHPCRRRSRRRCGRRNPHRKQFRHIESWGCYHSI